MTNLRNLEPRVGVAKLEIASADGILTIGREEFPQFGFFARLGVHVQSDQVIVAHPDPTYVETALTALTEACRQLGVPEAFVAFVDTVVPPPSVGLRYGFKGSFTTDRPTWIWIFANWTTLAELRGVVRHEAAHLAFARTHTAEEAAGHSGPSEDFALAFEREPGPSTDRTRRLTFMRNGPPEKEHDMALTLGILALVEAKPGKEAEVEAFVKSGRAIVEQEPGTRVWYGFRVDDSTFGIFDAFEDEASRQAHLSGQIPAALAAAGPQLLAKDPDIRLVDVLAVKGA